ncbi:MAG: CDP-alcohol phosphatidyltransferase family protein [Anaerolineales bacterium]
MEHSLKKKERLTLTDFARIRLKGTLDAIGGFLNRMGILPIQMTYLGLLGHALGAFFLWQGEMTMGGLVILVLAPVDALDGTMARLRGEPSQWGAFVDSTVDRYSELFVFGSLIYYFASTNNVWGALFAFLAASGSVLVSYVRARAQSLGFDIKIGILSRLERYLILIPSLVFNLPVYGMAIIAVGAHITALQRIFAMRREVHRRQE